jgi:tagaturonate reductase
MVFNRLAIGFHGKVERRDFQKTESRIQQLISFAQSLDPGGKNMQRLGKTVFPESERYSHFPERIIQFGEGNFLRGFVDWMVHELNKKDLFHGRIVAIQPTPYGKVVPKLNAQDGLYTLVLRGIQGDKVVDQAEVICSISRGINPYEQWDEVLKVAESQDIQFVFSNTTEAGLTYVKEEYIPSQSPLSFPGKLTAFLYHRYKHTKGSPESGLAIFPCELVEDNGTLLKKIVLQLSKDWDFPEGFRDWIHQHNRFCNTLVDRIVTGFPKDNIVEFQERLGYVDELITVGEPYHLFAIEADEKISHSIPFDKAGLNVYWADVQPFRELKVRILNGAHTMMFAAAYLSGKNTVLEAMKDEFLQNYIRIGIYQEILPTLAMDDQQKKLFADSVIERFSNPYIKHYLTDIGLNAFIKFKTRVIPTLLDSMKLTNEVPKVTAFSIAALLAYYKASREDGNYLIGQRGDDEYTIRDQAETLQFMKQLWDSYEKKSLKLEDLVHRVLDNEELWGLQLTKLERLPEIVHDHLFKILDSGMEKAIRELLDR